MKALEAMVLFAVALPAFGQSQPASTAVAPGCGPANIEFDVITESNGETTTETYDSVWARRRMGRRDAQRFLYLCFG